MKEKKKKKKKDIESEVQPVSTEEIVEVIGAENNEEIVIVASMTEEEALVEVEADIPVEALELESEESIQLEASSESDPTTIVAKEGLVYDRDEIVQAIEALVFASPKPISLQR
ncbi:MAG: hypothetical protein KA116_05045, partial [Proteobacteria bacterium]|nr:hypothetical protein [Pseudomonadota bacterium]